MPEPAEQIQRLRRTPTDAGPAADLSVGSSPPTRLIGGQWTAGLRRSASADPLAGQEVDQSIQTTLRRRVGGGEALPSDLAGPMGQILGQDLSGIRVHADAEAGELSSRLQSNAFTHGNDLYFAPGRFRPSSIEGQRLIAHELGHVVAQRTGADTGDGGGLTIGAADHPAEVAADRVADRTMAALRRSAHVGADADAQPEPVVEPAERTIRRSKINSIIRRCGRGPKVKNFAAGYAWFSPAAGLGGSPAAGLGGSPDAGSGGSDTHMGSASSASLSEDMDFTPSGDNMYATLANLPGGMYAPLPSVPVFSPDAGLGGSDTHMGSASSASPGLTSQRNGDGDGPGEVEAKAEPPAGSAPEDIERPEPTPGEKKVRKRANKEHDTWLHAAILDEYKNEEVARRPEMIKEVEGWIEPLRELDTLQSTMENDPDYPIYCIVTYLRFHPAIRDKFFGGNLALSRKPPAPDLRDKFLKWLDREITDRRELAKRQGIKLRNDHPTDLEHRLVTYDKTKEDQEKSLVSVVGGKLMRSDGKTPVDTTGSSTFHSGLGAEIFVTDTRGRMHMGSHKIGLYHHSSLLAGSNVSMAGELKVENGKIIWMSNKSGHYKPTIEQLVQIAHFLEKDGIDLSSFTVQAFNLTTKLTARDLVDGKYQINEAKKEAKEGRSYEQIKTETVWKQYIASGASEEEMKRALDGEGLNIDTKTYQVTEKGGAGVQVEKEGDDRVVGVLRRARQVLKEKFGVPTPAMRELLK